MPNSDPVEALRCELCAAVRKHMDGVEDVRNLVRLTGGASQEIWSFDGVKAGEVLPLILRRGQDGGGGVQVGYSNSSHAKEAEVMQLAAKGGVPVPPIEFILAEDDTVGPGFVMGRIEGEAFAPKILRDDAYRDVRPKLARNCGEIAARIHQVPVEDLPEIDVLGPAAQRDNCRNTYDGYDYPHPVFELAFQWLDDHMVERDKLCLVHGDFRNGNFIIGEEGVRSVLDWEIAHVGDPAEDLGWICVNSWRFGHSDKPVGGFGDREELLEGYASAGGPEVTREALKFWELFGSLKWGIICMSMYDTFRQGAHRSVERAAIGRRSSEAAIDILNLLREEG
jgi:aminoglycoside phosphotransferase (APT) family kinase protein